MKIVIILCGIYAALLILSGIFSKHKEVVMMGMIKQYEGLMGVLGYLVIFLAAVNYISNDKAIHAFGNTILAQSGLIGILALLEYKGHPLQEMKFMTVLMAPVQYQKTASALHSSSPNVHLTFFNADYFGGYCAMIFPVVCAITFGSKDIRKKIVGAVSSVLIVISAVLSNTSGGIYTIAIACLLFFIIYNSYWCRNMINRKKAVVFAFAIIICVCIGAQFALHNKEFAKRINVVINNDIYDENESGNGKSNSSESGNGESNSIQSSNNELSDSEDSFESGRFELEKIQAKGQSVFFTNNKGDTIEVLCHLDESGETGIIFFDTEGNGLETHVEDYMYLFDDERYKNCKFKFSVTDKLYCDLGYKQKIVFQYEDGKFKPYVHNLYTMEEINNYYGPKFLKNHLSLASGRGFIWGSTISILNRCILLGFGNGNFVEYFPQYDYVSLLKVYETPAMVVTKAHSWYLQIATDSGIISLIVVFILLFVFLKRGFKTCVQTPKQDEYMHLRIGLYLSVISYMIVGIVNDSYVCVSPVFWFIFGAGMYMISGDEDFERRKN